MRRIVMIFALAGACGRSGPGLTGAADPDAWIAPCEAGIERALRAPSWQRGRIVVDACRPCGVAWDPILAEQTPAPSKVVAVVDACKVDCPTTARSDFYAAISALEMDQPAHEAWLAFGKACPAAMGTPGKDGRYASGAWFALHQIGRALVRADRTPPGELQIALPLWSQIGTGYLLPPGRAPLVEVADTMIVTANAADDQFALLSEPVAGFDRHGLVTDSKGWPGEPLYPRGALKNALVVPIAMPIARLRAVLDTDDTIAAIAVAPPPNETLFGGEIAGVAVPNPLPPGWPPATGTVADAVKALGATPP